MNFAKIASSVLKISLFEPRTENRQAIDIDVRKTIHICHDRGSLNERKMEKQREISECDVTATITCPFLSPFASRNKKGRQA